MATKLVSFFDEIVLHCLSCCLRWKKGRQAEKEIELGLPSQGWKKSAPLRFLFGGLLFGCFLLRLFGDSLLGEEPARVYWRDYRLPNAALQRISLCCYRLRLRFPINDVSAFSTHRPVGVEKLASLSNFVLCH